MRSKGFRRIVNVVAVCLLGAEALGRTDYYTAGFFTRGSDAALYIDQGGELEPFYIPLRQWAFLPRVTVAATRDDNYFLGDQNRSSATTVYLIPGAMILYGRPEHNHLYVDTGARIPLYESASSAGTDYLITLGGVYKTGISQIYGRIGHRREEGADVVVGDRLIQQDYVGDVGLERRISTKSSLGVNGSAEIHDFGSASYVNYNRYTVSGRYYHRMTEKSQWFLQAGAGWDHLKESQAGVYSDGYFYDLSAGIRGKPSPKTSVSGRAGYRWKTFEDSSISDVSSWIANLGAEASPFGFSKFYTELMADIRPDITRAGDTTIDQRLTLGVNRRLFTERWRGDSSVFYGQVDQYGPGTSSDYEYWGFRLWLDYWTRWNLSFGAGYSYTERLGSGASSGYKAGTFSLRASWNY